MMRRHGNLFAVILLALAAAGCASSGTSGMWTDPEFDGQKLDEGLVVVGVVDLTSTRDLFEQLHDTELLAKAILAEHGDLRIMDAREARAVLDPDSVDAILGTYRSSARLTPQELETLRGLRERARFAAFARIDIDETTWEYPRRQRESIDRTVVDIEAESRRRLGLMVDLYDLELSRLVFTVPLERVGLEHGSTLTVEGVDAVPTEAELRDAVDDLHTGSDRPKPADRDNLLKAMFRQAAVALPAP